MTDPRFDDHDDSDLLGQDVVFWKCPEVTIHGEVTEVRSKVTVTERYALHQLWGYSNAARGHTHQVDLEDIWVEGHDPAPKPVADEPLVRGS